MHVLIFDHNKSLYTIINQYPKNLEIESYLVLFQKYIKRQHIIKCKGNYYLQIEKKLTEIYIDDENFFQSK